MVGKELKSKVLAKQTQGPGSSNHKLRGNRKSIITANYGLLNPQSPKRNAHSVRQYLLMACNTKVLCKKKQQNIKEKYYKT